MLPNATRSLITHVTLIALTLSTASSSQRSHADDAKPLTAERRAALERKVTALAGQRNDKVTLRTVRSHESISAGETARVAIDFRIRFGWHMYGAKPGGDYLPVTIKWQLPDGVEVTDVQWSKTEVEPKTNKPFHSRRARAIVTIRAAKNAAPGEREMSAKVTWQVCKEECRVGTLTMPIRLTIGETRTTEFSPLLEAGPDV